MPALLSAAHAATARRTGTATLDSAAALLQHWDRRYTRDNTGAVLFEAAMREVSNRTWDELVDGRASRRAATPSDAVLAQLLADPAGAWWDDRRTPAREDRDAVLSAGLEAGYRAVLAERGPPGGGGWRWDRVQHANIYHLLRIPAFSVLGLPPQGGRGTLSPSFGSGVHGASWRMVVELGPRLRAWGIYPGGQSGDPASAAYADRIPKWAAGELDPLTFPRSAAELVGRAVSQTLTLRPTR